MRTFLAPLALFASVVTGYAQFTNATLPPLSTTDGASIVPGTQETGWSSSALVNYSTSSSFVTPSAGGTDAWGHTWTTTAPNFSAINSGGTIREIFLGAGNDSFTPAVGYTYLTSPYSSGNSFTLAHLSDDSYAPSTLSFGDIADINLIPGWQSTFDLWVDTTHGVYTLFNPANSQTSADATANVLWTNSPLLVSTWVPADNDFENVETWIGSLVETPTAGGPSQEFHFAVQAFEAQGIPFHDTPVPEPSAYGAIGALAIGALIAKRKLRR
ncbi:MAG TPA: PEP-CTERM sorting domain-containing protein [Opitutaceae bacterium]